MCLRDTGVEVGHDSKAVSTLHRSLQLREALQRTAWSRATSFLPLFPHPLQACDTEAAGRTFHSVSTPKCGISFVCHTGRTCFYSLFGCCHRGIETFVLSAALWNLRDPVTAEGTISCLHRNEIGRRYFSPVLILQHCTRLCQKS